MILIRDYKKPSKRYGKDAKKQERLLKIQQVTHSTSFIVCEIVFILIVAIAGLIVFLNLKEQEQRQEIQAMIQEAQLTEAEHEVVEVKETMQGVYVPVDMYEKEMFNDKYTLYEVCLVSALAYREVGGSTVKNIMYAVSVIINRVACNLYPNTIEEVVYQAGQYEPALNGTINKLIDIYYYNNTDGLSDEELEDLERNFEATLYVFEMGSMLPGNVVYQAPFEQGDGVYCEEDGEIYSYDNSIPVEE